MSCGSCAARIERRLNRLDGVVATVNFATERAYISSTGRPRPGRADQRDPVGGLPGGPAVARRGAAACLDEAARMLRWRLAVCGPLAAGVIVMAMVPAAQFPGWQWLSLLLAGVVAVWGALAAAPGRVGGPGSRRSDDGHPGQRGGDGVSRVVAVRAAVRRG